MVWISGYLLYLLNKLWSRTISTSLSCGRPLTQPSCWKHWSLAQKLDELGCLPPLPGHGTWKGSRWVNANIRYLYLHIINMQILASNLHTHQYTNYLTISSYIIPCFGDCLPMFSCGCLLRSDQWQAKDFGTRTSSEWSQGLDLFLVLLMPTNVWVNLARQVFCSSSFALCLTWK